MPKVLEKLSVWSALVVAVVACSPPCETTDADPVTFADGCNPDGRTYQTSAFDAPYLHFPAGRVFDLNHYLGRMPVEYAIFLGFSEYPLRDGNISESAGNQAVVEVVSENIIRVRNDTCSESWLRLVAHAPNDGPVTRACDVP